MLAIDSDAHARLTARSGALEVLATAVWARDPELARSIARDFELWALDGHVSELTRTAWREAARVLGERP